MREECHLTITTYNSQVNTVNVVTEVREECHPTITHIQFSGKYSECGN